MNVYEVYFINLWKPPLNIDDKTRDPLTVFLPDVEWKLFETPLWDKWKSEIEKSDDKYYMRQQEQSAKIEVLKLMRKKYHNGEISESEYYIIKEALEATDDE